MAVKGDQVTTAGGEVDEGASAPWTHIWYWNRVPRDQLRIDDPHAWDPKHNPASRKGQRCRLIVQSRGPGPYNGLVEFEDGARIVVTRKAVRFGMRLLSEEDTAQPKHTAKKSTQLSLF